MGTGGGYYGDEVIPDYELVYFPEGTATFYELNGIPIALDKPCFVFTRPMKLIAIYLIQLAMCGICIFILTIVIYETQISGSPLCLGIVTGFLLVVIVYYLAL